jgi:hypothetical protein
MRANDVNEGMPKVEPADVFQKLVPFPLPSKFVDEIIEEDKIKNPQFKLSDTNKITNRYLLIILKLMMILIYFTEKLKLLKKAMIKLKQ